MVHVVTTVLTSDSFHPDVRTLFRMSLFLVDLDMLFEVGLVLAGITVISHQVQVDRLEMIEKIPSQIG